MILYGKKSQENNLTLVSFFRFLKISYKPLFLMGAVGVTLSIGYLSIAPKRYEATIQIAMAQFSADLNTFSPLGINIEEPSLLISRLSSPTSYTQLALKSCDADSSSPSRDLISAGIIKLSLPKGVSNVVELKAFGKSSEIASTCVLAIFELIKTTQAQINAIYENEVRSALAEYERRMIKVEGLIVRAEEAGQAGGAAYLFSRDEMFFLLDKIATLKVLINNNKSRATRIIAPIYVNKTPVAPKKLPIIAAGMFGGLLLGLLFVLAGQSRPS